MTPETIHPERPNTRGNGPSTRRDQRRRARGRTMVPCECVIGRIAAIGVEMSNREGFFKMAACCRAHSPVRP